MKKPTYILTKELSEHLSDLKKRLDFLESENKKYKTLQDQYKAVMSKLNKDTHINDTKVIAENTELLKKETAKNSKEIKEIKSKAIVTDKQKTTKQKKPTSTIRKDEIISIIKETVNINFINKLYRK